MKFKRGYYDVFVQTCAKFPSKIAIRQYENEFHKCYTYSELYGVCEYISQNLQQLKCNKGLIGLVSERNILIPCVIAAAHKCCTTFMFIDPNQDVLSISKELNFNILITIKEKGTSDILGLLNKKPERTLTVFNIEINIFDLQPPAQSQYVPRHSFIAMTSGSTGEPKHIQVPVQCIQPNIDDLTKLFNIVSEDIIYFSTPLTFDPSMIEILLACMNGASLLIAPDKPEILFPKNKANSITFWQTTPSKFFQHTDADIRGKILCAQSTLKVLALGGEPLNGIKRLHDLKHANNKTKIFTLYGVTEMSCWACVAELDLSKVIKDKEVPLGSCLSETQIRVDTRNNQRNKSGRIILVSKSRKCIVLNKPRGNDEENSLQFIDTGDIGEMRNGTIYYRGRHDDIIKRFGHKVNLQLVESTIMQCPKVKTCSCIWLPKPMLLVVYFSSETLSSQELSDFLKCKLDDKHWPDNIIRVDNLPTNPHGKISKQMLSKLYESVPNVPKTFEFLKVCFLTELEAVMGKYLTYDNIKTMDFFSLGGTSFLAVAMCNKLALIYPEFSKFLLPYLMTPKHTIEQIMQFAERELLEEDSKNKKKMKRSRCCDGSDNNSSKKATQDVCEPPIEFVMLWSYDTGKCVDASPTLHKIGYNLYATVGSHSGRIIVMDAITGALVGQVTLKSRVQAAIFCYDDEVSPPCGVVGAYDGTILCFTIENCKENWMINIKAMIKSKGACCKGLLYIAAYDGNVRCIDILTGNIKAVIAVTEQAISADLVLAKKQYILLGTLSGVCASIHTATNAIAWRCNLESPVFSSPVLYDNDKYVIFAEVNGEIHCRTVEKGIQMWKYDGAKGNIFSSIYVKKMDKYKWQMVFGCYDENVYSINVKNFQPSLHWTTKLTSPIYSTPCELSDKLILAVSNDGKLCVMDSDNGTILAEHQLPSETFSSPAVYGNYIFVGCRNDHLISLKYVIKDSDVHSISFCK